MALVAALCVGLCAVAATLKLAPPVQAPEPAAKDVAPVEVVEVAFTRVLQLPDPPRIPALIVGDSNIFGPLGKSLERSLGALGFDVKRRGKATSGLARPDFFDWSTEARRLRALEELFRVLRVGGQALVYVWAMEQQPDSKKQFDRQDVMVPWHLNHRNNPNWREGVPVQATGHEVVDDEKKAMSMSARESFWGSGRLHEITKSVYAFQPTAKISVDARA